MKSIVRSFSPPSSPTLICRSQHRRDLRPNRQPRQPNVRLPRTLKEQTIQQTRCHRRQVPLSRSTINNGRRLRLVNRAPRCPSRRTRRHCRTLSPARFTKGTQHPSSNARQGPLRAANLNICTSLGSNCRSLLYLVEELLAQEFYPSRRLQRHLRNSLHGHLPRHSPHYRWLPLHHAPRLLLSLRTPRNSLAWTRCLAYVVYRRGPHSLWPSR